MEEFLSENLYWFDLKPSKSPVFVPKIGPKRCFSDILIQKRPKLMKTIYQSVSIINMIILITFSHDSVKWDKAEAPKPVFWVSKLVQNGILIYNK